MATYSTAVSNKYQWFIDVTQTDNDPINNTSKVTVKFYMKKVAANSLSYNNYGTNAEIVINGTKFSISGFKFDLRKSAVGTTKTIATKSVTVKHDTNGSKTISISAKHWTNIVAGKNPFAGIDVSHTLNTINRVSYLTVPSAGDIGKAITINVKPFSKNFTHTINVSLDNSTWTEMKKGITFPKENTNNPFTFTIPEKFRSGIASGKTKTMYVRLQTWTNGKYIGVQTKTVTIKNNNPSTLVINDFYITSDTYKENGKYVANKTAFKLKCNITNSSPLKSIVYYVTGAHVQNQTFTTNLNNYLTWATTVVKNTGTVSIKITITDTTGNTATTTITATVGAAAKLTIDNFYITNDTYKENGKYIVNKTALRFKCDVTHTAPLSSIRYQISGAHSQDVTFTTNLNYHLAWATGVIKKQGSVSIKITIADTVGNVVSKTLSVTVGQAHVLSIQETYIDSSLAHNLKDGKYYKDYSRLGIRIKYNNTYAIKSLTVQVGSKVYDLCVNLYTNNTGYRCPEELSSTGTTKVIVTIVDTMGKSDSKVMEVFVNDVEEPPDVPLIEFENRTDNYVLLSEGEKIVFTGRSTNIKDYRIIYVLSKCDVINATSIYNTSDSYNGATRSELSQRLKNNATGNLRYVIYKDFDKDDKAIYQDVNKKNKFHLHPTSPNHSTNDRFYALQWFAEAEPGDMVYVYVIERGKNNNYVPEVSTGEKVKINSFYITNDTYKESGKYIVNKTAFKVKCDISHDYALASIEYKVTGAHVQSDKFTTNLNNYTTWATTVVKNTGEIKLQVTVKDIYNNMATKTITVNVGTSSDLYINSFYFIRKDSVLENGNYVEGVSGLKLRCDIVHKNEIINITYKTTGAHTQNCPLSRPSLIKYSSATPKYSYHIWATTPLYKTGPVSVTVTVTDSVGNKVSQTISAVVYSQATTMSVKSLPEVSAKATNNYINFSDEVYDNTGIAFLTMFKYAPYETLGKNITVTIDLVDNETSDFYYKTYIGPDAIEWSSNTFYTNGILNPSDKRIYLKFKPGTSLVNKIKDLPEPAICVKVEIYSKQGVLMGTLVGKVRYCRTVQNNTPTPQPHELTISDFYVTKDTYNENGKYIPGKTAFKVKCDLIHSHAITEIKYNVTGAHTQSETFNPPDLKYLTWATTVITKAGNVNITITITDAQGYKVTKTLTLLVSDLKPEDTWDNSIEEEWNKIPRSKLFPMCVLPPAPGKIQIYEKVKDNNKIVIEYINPVYSMNLGNKNPVHLIDVCLIAHDSKGNVINKTEQKKRDGKNGKTWIYYTDRKWHNVVPNATSNKNNKLIFNMEFDISSYPNNASYSIVAFYYSDYYIHPSIYSTSNVLRIGKHSMDLNLAFSKPINGEILSNPNPPVTVRAQINSAITSDVDPIYTGYNLATNWNKASWESNPIWFLVPRNQDKQLPNFRKTELYDKNHPYGTTNDYPTHHVEFYKAQEMIYNTDTFTIENENVKHNGIYKENALFLRSKNSIINLGDIDLETIIKQGTIEYTWNRTSEVNNLLVPGSNTLEAFTCPYDYTEEDVTFNDYNGQWTSETTFLSKTIMSQFMYKDSIIRPSNVSNWSEVEKDFLEIQIPYSCLEPDTNYKIVFDAIAEPGFSYENKEYTILQKDIDKVCASYMFTEVRHEHLKNVSHNSEYLLYRSEYKIIETSKKASYINRYDTPFNNIIYFTTPSKNVMNTLKDTDKFFIRLSARGVKSIKLFNIFIYNTVNPIMKPLTGRRIVNTSIEENLVKINVMYSSFNFDQGYIDPLKKEDIIALRDHLSSIALIYNVNIQKPWRDITNANSYLMARDFNDIKNYCYNLFTEIKNKYPSNFKGNPTLFKSLPTLQSGAVRTVKIDSKGNPTVDSRGKTYFSEWDDLIDIIRSQQDGSSVLPPGIYPPVEPDPEPKPPKQPESTISSLTCNKSMLLSQGGAANPNVKIVPADLFDKITYTVSPSGFVSVSKINKNFYISSNGKTGSCKVTFSCGNATATCTVSVPGVGGNYEDPEIKPGVTGSNDLYIRNFLINNKDEYGMIESLNANYILNLTNTTIIDVVIYAKYQLKSASLEINGANNQTLNRTGSGTYYNGLCYYNFTMKLPNVGRNIIRFVVNDVAGNTASVILIGDISQQYIIY
jgi:hypothetical protein